MHAVNKAKVKGWRHQCEVLSWEQLPDEPLYEQLLEGTTP